MLEISPIKFADIQKREMPRYILIDIPEDTFVRNADEGNITAESNNGFVKWAKKTDFIEKSLCETVNNPKNKIGSGFSHSAYLIPDNDDYILRMPNSVHIDLDNLKNDDVIIEECEDKNLKVNVGQKVAQICLNQNGKNVCTIEVLKKQKGVPLGVAPYETLCHYNEETSVYTYKENELPYESIERKHMYADTIHTLSTFPVESFENLITTIKECNDNGYYLDILNSNNLLIDDDSKSINVIDTNIRKGQNSMGDILYALTNISYFNTYQNLFQSDSEQINQVSPEEKMQAFLDTEQIIIKFTQAMKNLGCKFDVQDSIESQNLKLSFPFIKFLNGAQSSFEQSAKLKEMGLL